MSYLFGQTGIKDLKAIQEAAKGSSGGKGSAFQKLLNFLGSTNQQKVDPSGNIIPTNTFQATPVTEKLGITNVGDTKNPVKEIITAAEDTSNKEKESMLGSMFGVDYDKYIQGQKDLFKEMSQEGYRVGAMKRLPDLAHSAFGGSYATALQPGMANLAQIASNLRPYQFGAVNIPTRTNFASLLG